MAVRVLLVVRELQGHNTATRVWVEVLGGKGATGLVPDFTDYLSSMTVESEQIGVLGVLKKKKASLLIDEVVVEDVKGRWRYPKRWEQ